MSWVEKEQPTPFDDEEITGLYFLDGDLVADLVGRDWTRGQKYPLIAFPSGAEQDLWQSSDPVQLGIVHLFGEMDLPLKANLDEAYDLACEIGEACGYRVSRKGADGLELIGHDQDEHLHVVYDPDTGVIADVKQVAATAEPDKIPRPMPLLTDEIRQRLPQLYENEELGLAAAAHVKFFTPDSGWTWYASEFDGEDIFFGLVVGLEIEQGDFSLSELEEVRGPWGLPIERDLFFESKSLQALKEEHERARDD